MIGGFQDEVLFVINAGQVDTLFSSNEFFLSVCLIFDKFSILPRHDIAVVGIFQWMVKGGMKQENR